ncbi:hypothetical protein [Streptomyces alkaliterrae]|uniref:Uncharacterized protein n=1 Tax=Streptomyces alkaliterrae TaxID=2213162 RepID=A0A5P0YLL5_9ACTN|nr:hypothetical protein [Streptomyces alkaliterrae]MBB1257819.1 hypothetical protein [Streptomyces alkaliterrae]MQS01186.1 hypothetical protein [Streptomyces alkaliterrae]
MSTTRNPEELVTEHLTDEEIVRTVRRLLDAEERHDRLSERVDALRHARTAHELAERDRAGEAMAEAAERLLVDSCHALHALGLRAAARAVEVVAEDEGITVPDPD